MHNQEVIVMSVNRRMIESVVVHLEYNELLKKITLALYLKNPEQYPE